jgi:hypothetical protein
MSADQELIGVLTASQQASAVDIAWEYALIDWAKRHEKTKKVAPREVRRRRSQSDGEVLTSIIRQQ